MGGLPNLPSLYLCPATWSFIGLVPEGMGAFARKGRGGLPNLPSLYLCPATWSSIGLVPEGRGTFGRKGGGLT